MTLLETRVDKTAASAEASADKVSAVGHTTKTLSSQVEGLQRKTATDIPVLENKVLLGSNTRVCPPSWGWARKGRFHH